MANYTVTDSELTSVASAIRTKGGTSASLSFPDGFVTAIGNISGGSTPTLITKSITANGTYNASGDNADGYSSVTVAVPSKLVTGTFTGSTTGAAMSVTIPYTGSGYPVAIWIYPSYGTYKSGTDMYSLVQKSVVVAYSACKCNTGATPTYLSSDSALESNKMTYFTRYKNSTSDAAALSASSGETNTMTSVGASASSGACVRINSATQISVFIAGTSYGFKKDIEYTYQIVYSS